MDFRQKKLWLALGITSVGMAIALVWHGWQGWILHRAYPYNTFLYLPSRRFADLTMLFNEASLRSPYDTRWAGYLPATYPVMRCLGALGNPTAVLLYLSVCCLGLWGALIGALRILLVDSKSSLHSEIVTIGLATAFMLVSFPLIFGLDRANLEIFFALMIACAMHCCYWRRYTLSLICLFLPICFKLYPAILLVLFLHPRNFLKLLIFGILFFIVTYLSLLGFDHTVKENWNLWQSNLAFWRTYYLIDSNGQGASATPWSTLKASILTFNYWWANVPAGHVVTMARPYTELLYRFYSSVIIFYLGFVTIYVVFIEREFFRRAVALLISIPLSVPYGGEYRLLYIDIAMVILILLRSRRKHDFLVLGLLALATVPKREIILPYLGVTDTGILDHGLGVLVTPPCMIAAMVFILWDGLRDNPGGRLRLKISQFFNLMKLQLNQLRGASS